MAIGIPVLIGVSRLDPSIYGPKAVDNSTAAYGPVRDVTRMKDALFSSGDPHFALPVTIGTADDGRSATREAVIEAITGAISLANQKIAQGVAATIFVYYAGHGTRLRDASLGVTPRDALCLQDGLLFDVELVVLWKSLDPEARVLFIADTCHAADIATGSFLIRLVRGIIESIRGKKKGNQPRAVADDMAILALGAKPSLAQNFRDALLAGGDDHRSIACSLLTFAACGVDEILITQDGESPFASAIRRVMIVGPKPGSYADLAQSVITIRKSSTLSPTLAAAGREDLAFESSTIPFSVQ